MDLTDETWNPVTGCTKVSAGCKNCYAERMANRLRGRAGYPRDDPFRVALHEDRLAQPLRWSKPRRVFVCSMGDLFHEGVPQRIIETVFDRMAQCGRHTFQVLTKRPERAAPIIERIYGVYFSEHHFPKPLPNVWLGTSVEDQATADERIPHLLQTPAAVRFLSCEPLLGPVSLRWLAAWSGKALNPGENTNHLDGLRQLDWVIVGGESGPRARPMHPDWARGLRDQCTAAGVPFLFKQWGNWAPLHPQYGDTDPQVRFNDLPDNLFENMGRAICLESDGNIPQGHEGNFIGEYCHHQPAPQFNPWWMVSTSKRRAGRELDGRTWDEFPEARP